MRKFFPLKPISGVRNSVAGVEDSVKDDSRRSSTQDEHSVCSEVSSRNSFSQHVGRQHWCPTCSADTGTSCNTPLSCDENVPAPDEKDMVVDSGRRLLSSNGTRSFYLKGEFTEKSRKPRSRSSNQQFNVDKYVPGLGKKGNDGHASGSSSNPVSPLRPAGAINSNSTGPSRPLTSISKEKNNGTYGRQRNSSTVPRCILGEAKQSSNQSNEVQFRRQTSGLPPLDMQSGSTIYSSFSNNVSPISHTSKDGPSITLQPRSYSFSEASLFCEKSFNGPQRSSVKLAKALSWDKSGDDGTHQDESSSVSSDRSHFKYLSAKAVAEKLAKAIRGSSKSFSKDAKCSSPVPENSHSNSYPSSYNRNDTDISESSGITFESDIPRMASHDSYPNPGGVSDCIAESENCKEQIGFLLNQNLFSDGNRDKRPHSDIHVNNTVKCHDIETILSEESKKGQSWTLDNGLNEFGQERQLLTKRLESFIAYFDSSNEKLQEKARSVEERAVSFERDVMVVDDFILKHDRLPNSKEEFRKAAAAKFLEVQRKIRELQEDKGSLILEVAAELRQRIAERDSAKRVMGLMKTAVDLYVKVLEREKRELHSSSEKELEGRQMENTELRGRIQKLEEEKAGLENALTILSSEHNVLVEKVKNFEHLMERHRKRVEEAEKTILQLRQTSLYAQKQARQAEEDLQALRKSNKEKDGNNLALLRSASSLQPPLDHEHINMQVVCHCLGKAPCDGENFKNRNVTQLQQELLRLSHAEKALKGELQESRTESSALRCQVKHLEEELKSKEGNTCISKSDLAKEYEAEISYLKRQNLALKNENLRLGCNSRAALHDEKELVEAFETSESLKVKNQDKRRLILLKSEINLQDQILSGQCLVKEGIEKGQKEVHAPTSLLNESHQHQDSNEKLQELREDNRVQKAQFELLTERFSSNEVELELLRERYKAVLQFCGVVQSENTQLQSLLRNVNKRVIQLENQLREKEEKLKLLQENKEEGRQEISRLRKELSLVWREREDMQKQAEDLGREALRMSAQVEVLRRKANQLEEDVLLKEGQISILKGNYEACD